MLPRSFPKINDRRRSAYKWLPISLQEKYFQALAAIETRKDKDSVLFRNSTPEFLFAQAGLDEEVNLLISKFKGSKNQAMIGYSYTGNIKQVENLILQGVSVDHAIEGYASAGFVDAVNDLIKRGGSINKAVWSYASYGNFKEVNKLLENDASIQIAIAGYACGGYFDNESSLAYLLAHVETEMARGFYIEAAKQYLKIEDVNALLSKADIMNKYAINYGQACALKIKGVRGWLLQGMVLVKNDILPLEIFLLISQNILSLTVGQILNLNEILSKYHYVDQASSQFSKEIVNNFPTVSKVTSV